MPLLLLPGGHVRQDLPAIVGHWCGLTAVQRLPFLGAWPSWQRALRGELQALATATSTATSTATNNATGAPSAATQKPPLLLHHPIEGRLAERFLAQLERAVGGRCLATPYSADHLAELALTLAAPALPLALATNRLTDRLSSLVGPPLLQRPSLRQLLLDELEALP